MTTAVKTGTNVLRFISFFCTIADCGKFQNFLTDRLTIGNTTVYTYHSQMDKKYMNRAQQGWGGKGRRYLPKSRLKC